MKQKEAFGRRPLFVLKTEEKYYPLTAGNETGFATTGCNLPHLPSQFSHPSVFKNSINCGSSADSGGSHLPTRSRFHTRPCGLPGGANQ